MNQPRYPLRADEDLTIFKFISKGPKGEIVKVIEFTKIEGSHDIYNLAFGDWDEITGSFDDESKSNNGDADKVLATVVSAVYVFTDQNPDAEIYAEGSTPSRTRLYQMGIAKYLKEGQNDFEIYGVLNNKRQRFVKNMSYDGFLVKRKK